MKINGVVYCGSAVVDFYAKSHAFISNHSNKPQTLAVVSIIDDNEEVPSNTPKPFIDKISIVLDVPSPLRGEIHTSLWQSVDNPDILIDAGPKAKGNGYNVAKRIVIEGIVDVKKYPLIQFRDINGCVEGLRIEFVPVDLGSVGMAHLNSALTALMDGGWEFIAAFGMITRIDISVDIPNMSMDDFHTLPKQGSTSMQWSSNGSRETYLLGKSSGNQTLIYSRDKKRIAKKQVWTEGPQVRVERRLKNPKIKVKDLKEFPNPFKMLNLTTLPKCPEGEPSYLWEMFRDSVRSRGQVAALGLLPVKKRTAYREHLANYLHPMWEPDVIWALWPKMLEDINFVPAYPPIFAFGANGQCIYKP